ncbi:MAG: tetratricopeptide repeat protein [Pseudomonadota bacterium]
MSIKTYLKTRKNLKNIQKHLDETEYEQALNILNEMSNENIEDEAITYFKTMAFQGLGEYEKGLNEIEPLISEEDPNAYALELKGELYLHLDRFDDAIEVLKKAEKIDYDNVKIIYNLGLAHLLKGNYFEAQKKFDKVVRNDKHFWKKRLLMLSELLLNEKIIKLSKK